MKTGPSFEGIYYVHLEGRRVSQVRSKKDVLAYSSTLKMEAIFFTET
jgi:hypothetical protein